MVLDYAKIDKIISDHLKEDFNKDEDHTKKGYWWIEKDGYTIEIDGTYSECYREVTGASYMGATERWTETIGGDLELEGIVVYINDDEVAHSWGDEKLKEIKEMIEDEFSWYNW